MGRLEVAGRDGIRWIQGVITNDLEAMKTGEARYCLMTNQEGMILEDLIVYRLESSVLAVVNAANRQKVIGWMESHRPPGAEATLIDRTGEWAMISIQGPQSVPILTPLIRLNDVGAWDLLDYYHISRGESLGKEILISRTGYTGEDGFEIYAPGDLALELWNTILESGGSRITPIGLGARDTLRLEAAMPLYGNEIDETVNPYEARLGFAVKLKKTTPFVGQEALRRLKEKGVARRLIGFRVDSRKIARQGMPILLTGEKVGSVTSGIPSPTLGFPIALGYLDSRVVTPEGLSVDIRGTRPRIIPEPLPFFSRTRRRSNSAL
jgi:aminomethyltransferase